MVYLIGGPPRCGKTTLARRLARRLGCSWVAGDWLTQAFSMYVPDGEFEPAEYRRELPPETEYAARNDAMYSLLSADHIIGYYRGMAERTWPGLHTLLEYALHDGETLIVEGYQVDPALVPRFFALYPNRAGMVRAVFLLREDEADIERSILRGTDPNDWVLTRTRQEATFGRIARMIALYSALVRADAERAGLPVVSVDGAFEVGLDTALGALAD